MEIKVVTACDSKMLLQSRFLPFDHDGYKLKKKKKKKVIIAFQQKGRHGLRELGSNCAVPPFDSVSAANPAATGRPAQQKNNPKPLARIRGGDGETWCESWG